MKNLALKLTLGGILLVALIGLGMYLSASNAEIKLRNQVVAQQQACEAYYDKLWKVLKQKAGVTDQYKNGFKEIYTELISGRYQDQNLLLKFVTESNPTFDPALYKDLMASIEGQREGFLMEQRRLIDLDREHKTMRAVFPGSLFIGSRADVGITVVTSDVTEKVYEAGQENDIELFKR
ncbi:MAG TPA: hypothetical protein PLB89_05230 [Flavobacteriales bacterium]|nr:hypothetical protein [Flavobacteriales bacterium]